MNIKLIIFDNELVKRHNTPNGDHEIGANSKGIISLLLH